MKRLLLITIILCFVSLAEASVFFKVVDVPQLSISPCGKVNASVTVQNLGSKGEYANLIFREQPPGLWVTQEGGAKWVYPGGKEKFDIVLGAGQIFPGNYTFEIGIAARGAPPNYRSVQAVVTKPLLKEVEGNVSNETKPAPPIAPGSMATPGPGAAVTAVVLILLVKRLRP